VLDIFVKDVCMEYLSKNTLHRTQQKKEI